MTRLKHIALVLLTMLLMITAMPCMACAQENETDADSGIRVYNGFGELVGTFDTLEEAEDYINSNTNVRSSIDVFKKICKFISTVIAVTFRMSDIVEVYTASISYASTEEKIAEIIRIVVPQSILDGLARDGGTAYLYGTTDSNPYPPHSYQGATWLKTNTYYVVE